MNASFADASGTRSWGRRGPASDGSMSPRSSSTTCEYVGWSSGSCQSRFSLQYASTSATRSSGRPEERVALVEAYCKENLLWHEPDDHPTYSQVVELDLGDIEPSLAGPRRPQDRVPLASAKEAFIESLDTFGVDYANGTYDQEMADSFPASDPPTSDGVADAAPVPVHTATVSKKRVPVAGEDYALEHGSVVIAAITSCTNTSNPSVMIGAGLLAKKAVE